MGKSISITLDEDLLKKLDAKVAKENKSKTKNKTSRSKVLAEAFMNYDSAKSSNEPQIIEKEVIIEVEKIVEKKVPIDNSQSTNKGIIESIIDADTTSKVIWGLLLLWIIIF